MSLKRPEVVYYAAASLDGFIATPDGSVEWLEPFEASGEDYGYAEFLASIDALVMGSRTYEQALTFGPWPYAEKPAVVLSGRSLPAVAPSVIVADAAPPDAVDLLAANEGVRRIWLVGGGAVAGAFQTAELIDEYVVSIMPVLLGGGVGLLGGKGSMGRVLLTSSRTYADGVVQNAYRAAR